MKQNKIAMIYDFDGTLTPKTMQEYTLLPKLGLNPKSFWDSINEESKRTGGETMMVFMRHLLCLLYTSPSPRDVEESRMPSSA